MLNFGVMVKFKNSTIKILILVLLISFLSCKNKEYITFEDAILKCKEEQKSKQVQQNKSEKIIFILPSISCLENVRAPIINSKNINGKKLLINYKENKYTLINFWFMQCKPCVEEIPILNELNTIKGVKVIGISKDNKSDILDFMQKKKILYEIVPDGKDIIYGQFKNLYGFPTTYIINQEGLIKKVLYGFKKDDAIYKNLMQILSD